MYKLPWLGSKVQSALSFVMNTLEGRITLNGNNIQFPNSDLEVGQKLTGINSTDWSFIKKKDGTTLQGALDDINSIVTYEKPQITSFTMSPSTTQYEVGTSKTANSITFTWALNKSVTSATFDGQAVSTAKNGSAKNSSAVSATKTFTLTVSDGKNTATSSKTISFLPKVYYGVSDKTSLTSTEINALNGDLKSSRTGSYTMTAGSNQYCYLCLPSNYGTPKVKIGGFDTELVSVGTVSHTNASGGKQNYNVYRTKNTNLGEVTMVVS